MLITFHWCALHFDLSEMTGDNLSEPRMAHGSISPGGTAASQAATDLLSTRNIVRFLLLLLLLEALLFSWSFTAFFGSDTIFYFARRLENPGQILSVLSTVDDRGQYRPLAHILFSFVLYPVFKLNYVGHHLTPLLFHFANSVLVFFILRRILPGAIAVLAGSLYFGLHSVNSLITFSITFLADFAYAFFYLLALLLFLHFDASRRRRWLALSLACFVLSLLCKEAAITLPAVIFLCMIAGIRRSQPAPLKWGWIWRRVVSSLSGYILIAAAYLCTLGFIKQGQIFPRNSRDPYFVSVSVSSLVEKTKYGWWALNLPSGIGQLKGHPRVMAFLGRFLPDTVLKAVGEISNLYVRPRRLTRVFLMLPLLLMFFAAVLTRWRSEPMVIEGLLWFVAALSPVLLLAFTTMRHNLYIPLVGVAAVMGIACQYTYRWMAQKSARAAKVIAVCIFGAFLASSGLAVYNNLEYSWPARCSLVAETSLRDFQRAHPSLPSPATVYFVDNKDENIFFYFEGGNLFRLFYPGTSLSFHFQSQNLLPTGGYLDDPQTFVMAYYDTHLYDITEHLRAEARDVRSIKLIDQFDPGSVKVNEAEPYPLKGYYGSPGNKPAFLYLLARGGECRQALVTLAGASVRFNVPRIARGSTLMIGTAMVYDLGDGASGNIWLEQNGSRNLIFSQDLNPAQNPDERRWFDAQVNLDRYAPGPATLCFECSSGKQGDTRADWFAWSTMKIRQ